MLEMRLHHSGYEVFVARDGEVIEQLVCANCGVVHAPAEVGVRIGPGMPADDVANRRPRRDR